MALQRGQIDERQVTRRALRRRGVIAAVAALVAGTSLRDAQPVSASVPVTTSNLILDGVAMYGVDASQGSFVYGVYAAGSIYGVLGTTTNPNATAGVVGAVLDTGTGVHGTAGSGVGVVGTSSTGIGVFGVNTSSGAAPYGVVGAAQTAPGVALYGIASVAGTVGFAAGGINGAYAGQFSGQTNFFGTIYLGNPGNAFVVGPGVTKNAAVPVADGSHRLMHCVEAPEPWFEDFGEGTLSAGKAQLQLDADFAATVDTHTLHVFLTPHDETHHLAVTARSGSGFSVQADVEALVARGKQASDVNGTFSYRVVAKRKDVKGERFARFVMPKEIIFAPPAIPPTGSRK